MQHLAPVSGVETEVVLVYRGFEIHCLFFLHCPLIDRWPITLFLVLSFNDAKEKSRQMAGPAVRQTHSRLCLPLQSVESSLRIATQSLART